MALYGTRLVHTYTSKEEIERIFEAEGVDQFLSDIVDDTEFWTELIERVTARINQYLLGLFDPADLASSVWVREKAAYIGAHFLSIRAGNPSVYSYQFEDAVTELMAAKQGDIFIDLAQAGGVRPIMQNVMHDNRFSSAPIRVIPHTSSRVLGGQRTSYLRPFWWW